jgi:hypothetical protein
MTQRKPLVRIDGEIKQLPDGDTVPLPEIGNTGNGTFYKITVDAFGRVTGFQPVGGSDITTVLTYTPVNKAGDSMSGDLTASNLYSNGVI